MPFKNDPGEETAPDAISDDDHGTGAKNAVREMRQPELVYKAWRQSDSHGFAKY